MSYNEDILILRSLAEKSKEYTDKLNEILKKDLTESNTNIKDLKETLENELKTQETLLNILEEKIKEEKTKRSENDSALQEKIDCARNVSLAEISKLNLNLTEEIKRASSEEKSINNSLEKINSIIPSSATDENKLLDTKSAIERFSHIGEFKQNDEEGAFKAETYELALEDLKEKWPSTKCYNSDYAYIQIVSKESEILKTFRMVFQNEWKKQIETGINFSIAQSNALNSGITSTKLNEIETEIKDLKSDINTEILKREEQSANRILITQQDNSVIYVDLLSSMGTLLNTERQKIDLKTEYSKYTATLNYTQGNIEFAFADDCITYCDISEIISNINSKLSSETTLCGLKLKDNITKEDLITSLELGSVYTKNVEDKTDINEGNASNIPTVKQVKDYVKTYSGKIDSIKVNGEELSVKDKTVEITTLTEQKVSDMIGTGNLAITIKKGSQTEINTFSANSKEDKNIDINLPDIKSSTTNGNILIDGEEITIYNETDLKEDLSNIKKEMEEYKENNDSTAESLTEVINYISSMSISEEDIKSILNIEEETEKETV